MFGSAHKASPELRRSHAPLAPETFDDTVYQRVGRCTPCTLATFIAADSIATRATLPRTAGVYLFTEPGTGHLYVGRTSNLRNRIAEHCPGTIPLITGAPGDVRHRSSLARAPGSNPPTDAVEALRDLFANNPEWRDAVGTAVARIRKMEVRFVEESDPLRRALLELMAAAELADPLQQLRGDLTHFPHVAPNRTDRVWKS